MINASELFDSKNIQVIIDEMFPVSSINSKVDIVGLPVTWMNLIMH